MFWRFSCKIFAESQNLWIIGGSNPSANFQVRERGCHHNPRCHHNPHCHVGRFLCSSSMSSSLLVRDTTLLWEPQVWEGFFVLHDKENRHDKLFYLDEGPLVFVGHLAREVAEIWCAISSSLRWTLGTRGCRDLMCYFFTKYDGQIIGEWRDVEYSGKAYVSSLRSEVPYFG